MILDHPLVKIANYLAENLLPNQPYKDMRFENSDLFRICGSRLENSTIFVFRIWSTCGRCTVVPNN